MLSMQRRKFAVAAALLSACVVHGVTLAEPSHPDSPQVVHHAQGTITIPSVPQRVVVLDLGALDNLDTLGAPVVGVPEIKADMLPDWLSKYSSDEYKKVGTLFEPELDTIRELKPDLIVVGGRSSGSLKDLSEIAPTIDLSTSTSGFVPTVVQNLLTLGSIFNQEDLANQRAIELLQSVRELHSTAAEQGTGLLLFSVGESIKPQPPATRFGIIHELIGLPSVMTQADAGPPRQRGKGNATEEQTPEQIAQAEARKRKQLQDEAKRLQKLVDRDPNWLISLDRNSAFAERENGNELLKSDPAVSASNAYASNKVIYLSGRGWYLAAGGYQQMQHAIETVQTAFEKSSDND
ncbi:hypothetical protein CEE69_22955 [Rhodopirellula bahusiensis]|uniref:Fe/B12 periplasmic-binding domain-containing protein n=2 Tax=Rhodopirellula bahusiensis TaxID=2014065 RepID=A0A2G1W1K5_9BACT|nr:hypothetical protein CEE69_22955 [Rhodopirellula bahusiensis]